MWANILDKNRNNAQHCWYFSSSTSHIKAFTLKWYNFNYYIILISWPGWGSLRASSRAPNRQRHVSFSSMAQTPGSFRQGKVSLDAGGGGKYIQWELCSTLCHVEVTVVVALEESDQFISQHRLQVQTWFLHGSTNTQWSIRTSFWFFQPGLVQSHRSNQRNCLTTTRKRRESWSVEPCWVR